MGHVFNVSNLATWGICYVLPVFSYSVLAYISGIVNFITCFLCNPIFCLTKSIIVVMMIRMKYNTVVVPMADGGEVISSLLWCPIGAMSLTYTAFLKLHVLCGWC